jgi:hypothetical protein
VQEGIPCEPTTVTLETGDPAFDLCDPEDEFVPPEGFGEVEIVRKHTYGALVNFLTLPLVVRDLVFLGNVEPGHPLSTLDNSGLYALLLFLVVVGVALALLFWRYDEVER